MDFRSAYRTALFVTLIYVVLMIVPHLSSYVRLVAGGAHRSPPRATTPNHSRTKLSARDLEAGLRQANRLGADAQLRCEAARDWDYVCSYLPTALPSPKRLHFGVKVDLKRWVDLSPVVPVDTHVPPPAQRQPRGHDRSNAS